MFQPRIVPFSVENRKEAGAVMGSPPALKPEIWNPCRAEAMLKTLPVGAPPFPSGSPGAGMETTRGRGIPCVLCSVETPAPLSEIQNGEPPDSPTPHGFT